MFKIEESVIVPRLCRWVAALASFVLVQGGAHALPTGSVPQLAGLRIATPAGDTVEISSSEEALRGIALEADVNADAAGVDYFELRFTAPDGRILTYFGDEWTMTRRNYLQAADRSAQTYLLNEREIRGWYGPNSDALNQVGTWTLTSAYLHAVNGSSKSYNSTNFPAGVKRTFEVTRWFSAQPSDTVLTAGSNLTLSATLNAAQAASATYQWYRNGAAIAGANARTYSKARAVAADGGLYQLVATVGSTKVRTDLVVVSVRSADVIAARTALNSQNVALAKTKAASAVAAASTGSEELFVSAVSELLGVLSDSRTAAALKAFDVNGPLTAPFSGLLWSGSFSATASTAQATTWITQTLLPSVDKADANLEKITDQRFVTNFASGDFAGWNTSGGLLTSYRVDYGDVQMLRLGLNGLSAALRILCSVDTSVRVDLLKALLPQGKLSMESILKDYPTLLAAASGGAAFQTQALVAMGKGAAAYIKYSNFVYPSNNAAVTRLIDSDTNLFPARAAFSQESVTDMKDDWYLRDFAQNVTDSIAFGTKYFIAESSDFGGVILRYPINLKALGTRPAGLRSSTASQNAVPVFTKNLASGTIANQTLNGVLPDLANSALLARIIKAEPQITKALGTRDDQSAPVLILTDVPVSGNKILLTPDSGPVRLSGTVQDESEVTGVYVERTFGTFKDTIVAELEELQSVVVAGKTLRTWRWTVELDFDQGGQCSLAIYALDQFKQKSLPKSVTFTLSKAVKVMVDAAEISAGTLSVTPAIPANGLVEVGTKLRLVATAKPGYLFRLLEVVVNGVPEPDIARPTVDVVISAETVITPQFIVNPFPGLAGQWNTVLQGGTNSGLVSVTVGKTGLYTIKVTSGRNSFSYSGAFDASGLAKIPIPTNFTPYGSTNAGAIYPGGATQYAFLSLGDGGIKFTWNEDAAVNSSYNYTSYALDRAGNAALVASLPSKRYTTKLGNEYDSGFSAVDVGPSGSIIYSGIVNVSKSRYGTPVTFFRVSHSDSPHAYQRLYTRESVHLVAGHSYRVTAALSSAYRYEPGDTVEMLDITLFDAFPSIANFTYQLSTVGDHQEIVATTTASADLDASLSLSFCRNAANQVVEVGNVVLTDTTTGQVLLSSSTELDQWIWDCAEIETQRSTVLNNSNAGRKPVRFSASSYITARAVSGPNGESSTQIGFNFYGVGSPTEICVGGNVLLGNEVSGTLTTLPVLSGPLDPNRLSPTFYQYQSSYDVEGYPYVAPRTGQIAAPFGSLATTFSVYAGGYPMGVLSLVNARPSFRYSPSTPNGGLPVVKSASMTAAFASGAFSGTVGTQISGVHKSRTYSGVLLQGGSSAAAGLTADGLEISFQ